ncbi:hypothetical protein GUITHDRAFT_134726 [Guillardia theta CCMP2712]|uniref:Uncharacterized protein n=1 Tax=Guillardia theta (strain CCMP2712) TaxID=905079 RepID=L1JT12_GUITC|nr:hypothetical protein GUITHDRAFT_134726 [Guillardia theta CCMP2712]EKX51223.1 hypothetical protein GUITHDRAFT_134726 [Guillardia theta CCMP2712]|eukprot:XP_005838203.1 hypothetical protein GUITHDRAFT_134726 [Guillardia theta CCMP2712]
MARSRWIWRILVAACAACSLVSGVEDPCQGTDRWSKLIAVQRVGPQIRLVIFDARTGGSETLNVAEKISCDWSSSLAIDSTENRLYIQTANNLSSLDVTALTSTTIRLQGPNDYANGLWNLAFWEGGGYLVAMLPNRNTTGIIKVDPNEGIVQELHTVRGTPIKGLFCLSRFEGSYYFVIRNVSQSLLCKVDLYGGTAEGWSEDAFKDLVSIHWDGNDALVGIFLNNNSKAALLRKIHFNSRLISDIVDVQNIMSRDSFALLDNQHLADSQVILPSPAGPWIISRNSMSRSLGLFQICQRKFVSLESQSAIGMVVWYPAVAQVNSSDMYIMGNLSTTVYGLNFGLRSTTQRFQMEGVVRPAVWVSDSAIQVTVGSTDFTGRERGVLEIRNDNIDLTVIYRDYWKDMMPSDGLLLVQEGVPTKVSIYGLFNLSKRYFCQWNLTNFCHINEGCCYDVAQTRPLSIHEITCNLPSSFGQGSCDGFSCVRRIPFKLVDEFDSEVPCSAGSQCVQGFTIHPAAAVRLHLIQSTAVATAGKVLDPPFSVTVVDEHLNTVPTVQGQVRVKCYQQCMTGGEIKMAGNITVEIYRGTALFTDLAIETAGNLMLLFEAEGLSVLPVRFNITVFPAEADHLTVDVQPHQTIAGSPMLVQPTVHILDKYDNVVREGQHLVRAHLIQETYTFDTPPNVTTCQDLQGIAQNSKCFQFCTGSNRIEDAVLGNSSVLSSGGVVAFTDLSITAGTSRPIRLHFASDGLLATTSDALNISHSNLSHICTCRGLHPSYVSMVDMDIPLVYLLDSWNNILTHPRGPISVRASLHENATCQNFTAGGHLFGMAEAGPELGVVTFSNLQVNTVSEWYFMRFEDEGQLTSITSDTFAVRVGVPHHLSITQQPSDGVAMQPLPRQPVVHVLDAGNNTVPQQLLVNISLQHSGGYALLPNVSLHHWEGEHLFGSTSVLSQRGVVTLTDLYISLAAMDFQLIFTSSCCLQAESDAFEIVFGPAWRLAVAVQPGNGSGGLPLESQPQVDVLDQGGNRVFNSSATVVALLTFNLTAEEAEALSWNRSGSCAEQLEWMVGNASVVSSSGRANFTNVGGMRAEKGYRFFFCSVELYGAFSEPFDVLVGQVFALKFFVGVSDVVAAEPPARPARVCLVDRGENIVLSSSIEKIEVVLVSSQLSWTVNVLSACISTAGVLINKAGTYRLAFSLPVSEQGKAENSSLLLVSDSFRVLVGAPFALFLQDAINFTEIIAGHAYDRSLLVSVLDKGGNVVTNYSNPLQVSLQDGNETVANTSLSFSLAYADGTFTISNLTTCLIGSRFSLLLTSGELPHLRTALFVSRSGEIADMRIVSQTTSAVAGTLFSPINSIEIIDKCGNRAFGFADGERALVELVNASSSVRLYGINSSFLQDGVVQFSELMMTKAGQSYFLRFVIPELFNVPLSILSLPLVVHPNTASSIFASTTGEGLFKVDEPLGFLSVQVLDKYKNEVEAGKEHNISVELLSISSKTITKDCVGYMACDVEIDVVEQDFVAFAFLSVSLTCTDFDHKTEFVRLYGVGNEPVILDGESEMCMGSCARTETVLHRLDVTQLARGGKLSLSLQATEEVNYYPCDGNFVIATFELILFLGTPSPSFGTQHVLVQTHRSLEDLSILTTTGDYLLLFQDVDRNLSFHFVNFTLLPGNAVRLQSVRSPAGGRGGELLDPQPIVHVEDAGGNLISEATVNVSASLIQASQGNLSSSLRGGTVLHSQLGVAAFTDLLVLLAPDTYKLLFSAQGLATVASGSFNVTIGPPRLVSILTMPSSIVSGETFAPVPVAQLADLGRNFVEEENVLITADIAANGGVDGELVGETTRGTNASGTATFGAITIHKAGEGYSLSFRFPSVVSPESSTFFNVTAGTADRLRMRIQPVGGDAGVALNPQPSLEVTDSYGNVVRETIGGLTVQLLPTSGIFTRPDGDERFEGTGYVQDEEGVIHLYNLTVKVAGGGFRFRFGSAVLASADSNEFAVRSTADMLVLSGRALVSGRTTETFGNSSIRTLLLALASVGQVDPTSIEVLGVVDLKLRRRRLLVPSVQVAFEISTFASLPALTLNAVNGYLAQHNSSFLLLQLDIFVKPASLDSWQGLWVAAPNVSAGVKEERSTSSLSLFLQSFRSHPPLSCQGRPQDSNQVSMFCYDAEQSLFGAVSLIRSGKSMQGIISSKHLLSQQFTGVQHINSFLFSDVNGPVRAVVLSSSFRDSPGNAPSPLLSISLVDGQLNYTKLHDLYTEGAVASKHLSIFGKDYLFFANHFDFYMQSYVTCSFIYTYERYLGSWRRAGQVVTFGASAVEAFQLDGESYVTIANFYNGSDYELPSSIYRISFFNAEQVEDTNVHLTAVQTLQTNGARDVKKFERGQHQYLVFTSQMGNRVDLLLWDGDLFQPLAPLVVVQPTFIEVSSSSSSVLVAIASAAGGVSVFKLGADHSLVLLQNVSSDIVSSLRFIDLPQYLPHILGYKAAHKCILWASSPYQEELGMIRIFCNDASSPDRFSLTHELPSSHATAVSLLDFSTASFDSFLLSASGWKGSNALEYFHLDSLTMAREADRISSPYLDSYDLFLQNSSYLISSQLWDGNQFAKIGTLRSACVQLNSTAGDTLTTNVSSVVDESGAVVVQNFSFPVTCKPVTLQFAHPFLFSDPSRVLSVIPYPGTSASLSFCADLTVSSLNSSELLAQLGSQLDLTAETVTPFDAPPSSLSCFRLTFSSNDQLVTAISYSQSPAFAALGLSNFTYQPAAPAHGSLLSLLGCSQLEGGRCHVVTNETFSADLELRDCFLHPLSFSRGPLQPHVQSKPSGSFLASSAAFTSPSPAALKFSQLIVTRSGNFELDFSLPGFLSLSAPLSSALRSYWNDQLGGALQGSLSQTRGSSISSWREEVLVLGGGGGGVTAQGAQLRLLNTADLSVKLANTTGTRPPPLVGHATVVCHGSLWVLGGRNAQTEEQEEALYRLDLQEMSWTSFNGQACRPVNLVDPHLTCSERYLLTLVNQSQVSGGCAGAGAAVGDGPVLLRYSFVHESWGMLQLASNFPASAPPPLLFGDANLSSAYLVDGADRLFKVDLDANVTTYLSSISPGSHILTSYDWVAAEKTRFLFVLPSDSPSSPSAVRVQLLDLSDEANPLFIDLLNSARSFPNMTSARLTLLSQHRFLLKVDRSGQDTSTLVLLSFSKSLQLLLRPRGLPATAMVGDILRLDPLGIADLGGSLNTLDNSTEVRVSVQGQLASGLLAGRTVVKAVGGRALFTDLRVVTLVSRSPLSLVFSSPGLLPFRTPPLVLRPGSVRSLRLSQEPLGVFVGEAFYEQPKVELLDEGGNVVDYDRFSLVTAQLTSSNGSVIEELAGTAAVKVENGVASWSDLKILSAPSSPFFLSFYRPGVPRLLVQLNFTSFSSTSLQVGNVTSKEVVSGKPFILLVERVIPEVGSRVIGSDDSTQVTVQLVGDEAASLGGQTTVTMTGGVATFSDLVIDKAGQNYSFLVSAASSDGQALTARSARFVVLPAQYFRLSIVVEANSAYGGEAFAVQPEIELLDLQNNRATLDDHTRVAVELVAADGGGGKICGKTIRTAEQGLVKFTDLAVDRSGSYTLRFSASSYNETVCYFSRLSSPDVNCSCNCSVQGAPFAVDVGGPYRLVVQRSPSNGTGGTALPTQPQVGVVDRGGNYLQQVAPDLSVSASLEIPRTDISDFLVLLSSFPTSSVLGMLHLRVQRDDYVVFASFEANGDTSVNSTVYILNTQGQLVPQLDVLTSGASDWSTFKVEEEHFLVLSNLFDASTMLFDVPSHVYRFMPGNQPQLFLVDSLQTVGAISVEAFQVGKTPMAAIACQGDGTAAADSLIFTFNSSGHPRLLQRVETHLAQGVAHMSIDCLDYLVISNSFNFTSATGEGSVLVLRWEETAFTPYQLLPLQSPTAVSAYVASTRSFLLVGSRFGNSSLFLFDGGYFRLLPPLSSAVRIERLSSFEYGGTSIISFASSALNKDGSATVGLVTHPNLVEEGGNFVWEAPASVAELPLPSSVSDVLHVRTFGGPDFLVVSERERTSVFALHPRKALTGQSLAVMQNGTGGGNAVATFEDLAVPEAGRWNFRFSSVNLEEAHTGPFLVKVGPRHSLSVLVQPAQGRGGEPLLVQPSVRFLDAGGNWIADAEGDVVSAVLEQDDSTFCLNRSNVSFATTVGGVANFTDLIIKRIGSGYTFLFSSSTFNVTSANVTVLPGNPTSFRWVRYPADNETVGTLLSQPSLVAMDPACNDAASHSLRVTISFSYDPSGMATLLGTTTIYRKGPVVTFTDLMIDKTGSRFQLKLQLERAPDALSSSWNGSEVLELPARFAGGDVSSFFSVLPRSSGSLVSTRRVVARGWGTAWPNGTLALSLGASPRSDYLAGFFVRVNSSSSSSPHLFRIKSQTFDPATFSVSLVLFGNPRDFQLEGQVKYEILAPAGDELTLEVRGSNSHPSAHGVYDLLTEGEYPSFLQRTTTSLLLNASGLGLAAEYDGVYAVVPERVNGKTLYKQEEGSNFLFQNGTDSVLYWPSADNTQDRSEGWIFDEAASSSSWIVGDAATLSGERVNFNDLVAVERRHVIEYDQLNLSWVLRDGETVVFRASSQQKSPGLFLQQWVELNPSNGGISWIASSLEITYQPAASFSDDWGNVADFEGFQDTELVPKSKIFAQSCFSNLLIQRLVYGSYTSKSFQVQGRDLVVLVSGAEGCLPEFQINSTMMMWIKRKVSLLRQIDNGDFDGELDACPGGWTCEGNVSKNHDWNSPFLVHRAHGSFQPTRLFNYKSRLPPPGIALGPFTGRISQTILHGAHKGDVIRVNFSAAQDWFNGTMSAYLSRPVGQLTVLMNEERVFGPITPSPIHYYELQNYSFLARVDRPYSVLTFLYTSYEQRFSPDYPAARTIVTAVEITMHSSLLPFEAIELTGSMIHPEFHGEYMKTDVKYDGGAGRWYGGANVYWKQVTQDISMSCFLFFEHSRGSWMVMSNYRLRRGAPPEFVAAGSAYLLRSSDGGAEPLHRVSQFGPDYAGVLGPWREWNASFDVNDTRAEEAGLQALRDLTACKYANVTSGQGCFYEESLDLSIKELPSTLQTIFEIPTLAAVDCENFTVGNSNFLVFASFYNESGIGSYFVDSHVRWRGWTQQMEVYKFSIDGSYQLHQNLSTAGAIDLEVFELAGQIWLVVAQYFDGLYYTSGSPLYRWVGEEDGQFELYKTLPTKAPRRWKHMLCGSTNYLLVTQGSVYNSTDIYVWRDALADFVLYHSVDQPGDDLGIFQDQCLFVVAGSCDGCTRVYQIRDGVVAMQQALNVVRVVGLSTFRAGSQLVIALTIGSDSVDAGCGNSTSNSTSYSPAHVELFAATHPVPATNRTITVPDGSETVPGAAQHVFMDSQHYLMVHSLTETQLWAVEGTGFRGGAKSLTFWPEDGANAALVRYSGAAPWSRFDCNGTSLYAFEMSSAMRSSYSSYSFAVQGKNP